MRRKFGPLVDVFAAKYAAKEAAQKEYALSFEDQKTVFEAKKQLYALASMPPGYVKDYAELEANNHLEDTQRHARQAEDRMAAQDKVDAAEAAVKEVEENDALSRDVDQKTAKIAQGGAHITLALRVGAGLCALAGLIILSYWLATGGTRLKY
jgi:hypothetical protein